MIKKIVIAISLLLTPALYANVVVVVHPSNTADISRDDINRLYTGRASSFPSGGQAVPINLVDSNSVRNEFDDKVLGRSSSQIKAHWSKLVFTGKGSPPKEVNNDAEVLDLVANNPSIIGYVSKGADLSKVRAVLTVD
ncbi:phosphate ABC transporter substrate-binding protein [Alishewanella sp. d11]|uniref:phosphate ABC transporter substrate-binding protein n=1 Tax=Alishewanella sp. d11 TaxID=3414030 RepID=UPI003BF823CF